MGDALIAARHCRRAALALLVAGSAVAQPALLAQPAQPAQPALPVYSLDPTHTFVHVELALSGLSTLLARLDRKQGTLSFDRAGRAGSIDISIDMDSLNTGVPVLDERLRAALEVQRWPTARFAAQEFAFSGDNLAEARGELTLHGSTRPLVLRATGFRCYVNPLFRRDVCGADLVGEIAPSAFGIAGMPERVRLLVQVEAIRQ